MIEHFSAWDLSIRLMGSIIFLANGSARNAQRLMHAIV